MDNRPRCAHCGELIGVYEPARLLLPDGTERRGSPLTFADHLGAPGTLVVHERCFEDFQRARRTQRKAAPDA
jgi:hypothetical protein